jgi:hypothetical protein
MEAIQSHFARLRNMRPHSCGQHRVRVGRSRVEFIARIIPTHRSAVRAAHSESVVARAVCRKHMTLAHDRTKRKRDGLSVRHASRGGVHLMLANLQDSQLRERAGKIPGDKKHVEGFSRRIIALRSSKQYRSAHPSAKLPIRRVFKTERFRGWLLAHSV